MPTKMRVADLTDAVAAFRSCLPLSGAKGRVGRCFSKRCAISRFTASPGGLAGASRQME